MSANTGLFNTILQKVRDNVSYTFIKNLKTKRGDTQAVERDIIQVIREVISGFGLTFKEAGSQQPYDFRICLPGHEEFAPTEEQIRKHKLMDGDELGMLLLEVKKTDSNTVYFNDTCPGSHVSYLMIHTGKVFARREEILPAVYGINGGDIISSSPWLLDFKRDIDALKEKYKETAGLMTVYPRPTYKANMELLFKQQYEIAKICKPIPPPPPSENITTSQESSPLPT